MSINLREKLLSYIKVVDDKKIEALFVLLEDDINNQDYALTDEQLAEVEKAREDHHSGKIKGHSAEESIAYIKGKVLAK